MGAESSVRGHEISGTRSLLSTCCTRGWGLAGGGHYSLWVGLCGLYLTNQRTGLRQTRSQPDLPRSGLPPYPQQLQICPLPPITPGPTALEFLPHWVSGQGSLPLAALTVVVTVGRAPAVWAGLLTLSLIALSCPSACGCSV